jgi:hypothetical protein
MRNLLAHALESNPSPGEADATERARKAADRVLRDSFWQNERSPLGSVLSLSRARAKRLQRPPL